MRSLPRIMKEPDKGRDIKPFDFFAGFKLHEEPPEEELSEETKEPDEEEEAAKAISAMEEEILANARMQADKILADAREQAEILREQGYREGLETGRTDGYRAAYEEQKQIHDAEIQELERNIREVITDVSIEKEKLLEKYVDDLKRVSLAVAEKIIQTSLQSSGDIVKRMIISATDKMQRKQWAKIYVTKCEAGISMEVDTELLEALSKLSDNINLITMDNGEPGTCIIELPDEIIDASVGTQLENIKDILNNVRV